MVSVIVGLIIFGVEYRKFDPYVKRMYPRYFVCVRVDSYYDDAK